MGASRIDYVSHSWGPWRGCTPVSPGCGRCYAARDMARYGKDFTTVVRASHATFYGPLSLTKYPPGSWVFVCPWSDFWHAAADPWRAEATDIIRVRQDVVFVIPTKRPERIEGHTDNGPLDNVIVLATTEDQERADLRIPPLLRAVQAFGFRTGVSVEPCLGPVGLNLGEPLDDDDDSAVGFSPCGYRDRRHQHLIGSGPCQRVDWVICGCESGPGARPMDVAWARALRDQCQAANVPFFLKQMQVNGKLVKMPKLDGRSWGERP